MKENVDPTPAGSSSGKSQKPIEAASNAAGAAMGPPEPRPRTQTSTKRSVQLHLDLGQVCA